MQLRHDGMTPIGFGACPAFAVCWAARPHQQRAAGAGSIIAVADASVFGGVQQFVA